MYTLWRTKKKKQIQKSVNANVSMVCKKNNNVYVHLFERGLTARSCVFLLFLSWKYP